jgi:hypothetical protein
MNINIAFTDVMSNPSLCSNVGEDMQLSLKIDHIIDNFEKEGVELNRVFGV